MKSWLWKGVLAAVIALPAVGWVSPAWAPTCSSCATTGLMLPLQGSFFYPPTPCNTTGEAVILAGEAHVVTVVRLNFVTEIHLNMAGVQGTGQITGNMFIGTGSYNIVGAQISPGPTQPFQTNFTLEPTDGCASVPLLLTFRLALGSDGTLSTSSTVEVTTN